MNSLSVDFLFAIIAQIYVRKLVCYAKIDKENCLLKMGLYLKIYGIKSRLMARSVFLKTNFVAKA